MARNIVEIIFSGKDRFSKTARNLGSAIGRLSGIAAKATALLGGVGGGGLIGTLGLLRQRSTQNIDSLAKVADKLGIATEKLSTFRVAGELTGNTTRTIDTALQRLTRRVAEAAQGVGVAADAIEALGLDAQDLARGTPDEAFIKIAESLNRVEGQSQKVAVAFKLFDTEGVGLLNTLRLGEQGLEDMEKKLSAINVTVSRFDASKIEQANDAWTLAGKVLDGVGNTLAVKTAPLIKFVADELFNAAAESGGFARQLASLGDLANDVFASMARGVTKVQNFFDLLTASGTILGNKATELAAKLGFLDEAFAEGAGSAEDLDEIFERMFNRTNDTENFLTRLEEGLKKSTTEMNKTARAAADLADKVGAGTDAPLLDLSGADSASDAAEAAAARAAQIFEATRNPVERLGAEVRELVSLYQMLDEQGNRLISQDTLNRGVTQALDSYERLTEKAQESFQQIDEFQRQAARSTFQAVSDGFFEPFDKGLDGMVEGFKNAARRILANALTQQLFTLLSGVGGGFGAFFAAGAGLNTPGAAHGGTFRVPGSGGTDSVLAMVRASPGERIQVGNDSGRFGGSGGVMFAAGAIVLDARGADPASTTRLLAAVPALERRIVQTVADQMARGKLGRPRS